MIVLSFFSWWYGRGWSEVFRSLTMRLTKVNRAFSVSMLIRTLFAPWRRIMSYPGAGLAAHVRAWGDNMVSRVVGFVVRLLVLFAALLTSVVVGILSMIELIVWPLLPPAVAVFIILGFFR